VDETGAALFVFEAACRELRDDALDRELWPAARRAADFLCGFVDPETGLPFPSVDLWEERQGEHAYSAAAVAGGLRAAAALASRHEPALAGRYEDVASSIRAAIERELWSEGHGRYLRSRWVGRADAGGEPLPAAFASSLPYPNRPVVSADAADATVDIALLGLAWPFGAVDPGSERMCSTVAAIEEALVLADGGVLRYDGDVYAGGNPWILTTLWLGLWYRQVGDEEGHRRCLDYAVARQSETGLLPEQVTRDGEVAWVLPLTWSHAMLVLAARPELDLVAER
jgi:GH15 family glucan-1,4-alpha-glucosidase